MAASGSSILNKEQAEKSQSAEALIKLGIAHHNEGKLVEAMGYYCRVLAEDPDCAEAYFNIATVSFSLGQIDGMWKNLHKALTLEPRNARLYVRASMLCQRHNDFVKSIEMAQRAVELQPEMKEAWSALATAYQMIGGTETEKQLYERMMARFPDEPLFQLQHAWLLPHIYNSREEIARCHQGFIDNLDRLIGEGITVPVPNGGEVFPFYHSYHGLNNMALMRKLSEFFLRCCPDVHYTAPHCREPRQRERKNKIRIGFVSHMMHMVTLNQFYLKTLEGLAADPELEIIVFSTPGIREPGTEKKAPYKHVLIPFSLAESREIIAAEEINILVYLEIGMSNQSYFQALARLAPIQCVMGGHPITTGIPNMDYFITGTDIEPKEAQEAHYTETLVKTDGGGMFFPRPAIPEEVKSRRELGLPEDVHIYTCPVMLFKLHPDMDRVFAAILERDPKACILLFDSGYKTLWRSQLQKRFPRAMLEELSRRIIFKPFMPKELFFHMLRAADAVLDPFHFSFGQTAFLAVAAHIPFVTWPGEFLRGRTGYWVYRHRLHMPEMLPATQEEYIELALRLANDKMFYAEMSRKMSERSHALFEDMGAIHRLADCLKGLA